MRYVLVLSKELLNGLSCVFTFLTFVFGMWARNWAEFFQVAVAVALGLTVTAGGGVLWLIMNARKCAKLERELKANGIVVPEDVSGNWVKGKLVDYDSNLGLALIRGTDLNNEKMYLCYKSGAIPIKPSEQTRITDVLKQLASESSVFVNEDVSMLLHSLPPASLQSDIHKAKDRGHAFYGDILIPIKQFLAIASGTTVISILVGIPVFIVALHPQRLALVAFLFIPATAISIVTLIKMVSYTEKQCLSPTVKTGPLDV